MYCDNLSANVQILEDSSHVWMKNLKKIFIYLSVNQYHDIFFYFINYAFLKFIFQFSKLF